MAVVGATGRCSVDRPRREAVVSALGAVGNPGSGLPTQGLKPGAGRTALDSEIAQCQRQLADLVTCPSSKTPEGKAAMQALSDKITAARASINNAPSRSTAVTVPQPSRPSPPFGQVDVWA